MNGNEKKSKQLGMNHSTAQHRLKKHILFKLIVIGGFDKCYQCGEPILTPEELSVEHKIPWLDSKDPEDLFWDLDNIAFSHLRCNCKASRPRKKSLSQSQSTTRYKAKLGKEEVSRRRREQYLRTGN